MKTSIPYRRDIGASSRRSLTYRRHFILPKEEECQLKGDVATKSLKLPAADSEVDMKSKALTDLKAVPTLSLDDVLELERHNQVMLHI